MDEGSYFGEALFVGYVELCTQMNMVAIETQKQLARHNSKTLPAWTAANQDLPRVVLLPSPKHNGEEFVVAEIPRETRSTLLECGALIPVVLIEQR